MTDIENDYNTRIDQLRKLIKSTRNFGPAIELALNIHGITHRHCFRQRCSHLLRRDTGWINGPGLQRNAH